ncbi:FAH family protein [Opisthorchis viverrini]|uniref:oxaloacetate tautomerase n=2 Tax=Opisthorchis viverrini TaxID=6198 RepID=A0A1S8WMZ3_OPIVI|nr:FAH family protein [Opisthorchis viverrini]
MFGAIQFRDCLLGFVVAMDMTNRALQNQLKSRQLPWTLSKSFDTSCPVGPLLPCSMLPPKLFVSDYEEFRKNASTVELWLRVNGTEHQRATIDGMIHSPAKLISFISHHMRLEPGDLILTGTPAGVGPVKSGDVITAGIKELCEVEFRVA